MVVECSFALINLCTAVNIVENQVASLVGESRTKERLVYAAVDSLLIALVDALNAVSPYLSPFHSFIVLAKHFRLVALEFGDFCFAVGQG